MDADDVRGKLEELGAGGWTRTAGGTRAPPPSLQRQRKLLEDLKQVIQVQVERDKATATDLHEKLVRLKHGGGR